MKILLLLHHKFNNIKNQLINQYKSLDIMLLYSNTTFVETQPFLILGISLETIGQGNYKEIKQEIADGIVIHINFFFFFF